MPGSLRAALGILGLLGLLAYGGLLTAVCLVVGGFVIPMLKGPSTAGGGQEGASPSPGTQRLQEARDRSIVSADEPDAPNSSQATAATEALEKVFDCVYAQFLAPWYDAPEPVKDQPLYKALHQELMAAADAIISETAHVTRSKVLVGLIKNLALHLHGCSENTDMPKKQLFQTEVAEVDFFRRYMQELIAHLLPSSLADSQLAKMFLTEILAVKVLKPTVNLLADPDYLNQILISKISGEAAKPLPTMGCHPAAGDAPVPTAQACSNTEDDAILSSDEDATTVSKPKKKKGFKSLLKLKRKKPTVTSRSLEFDGGAPANDEVDGNSEDEGSTVENEADGPPSSEESSALDMNSNIWTSLTKMLCEDWNRHRWKATVSAEHDSSTPRDLYNGEQIFTIHVEDEEQPAEIQWDIERTVDTFVSIQKILSKDFPDLKKFQLGSRFEKQTWVEIEDILNSFLKRMVFIIQNHQNSEALCFLLPIELSPENVVFSEDSSDEFEADGLANDQSRDSVDEYSTFRSLQNPKRQRCERTKARGVFQRTTHRKATTMSDKGEGQGDTLETAYSLLLKEILGSSLNMLLKRFDMPKRLLNNVQDVFNQIQWEASIDSLRKILWPNGKPAPPLPIRSPEDKNCTTRKAMELLVNMCTTALISYCWRKKAKRIFNIFQDANQNKILICRWLLFVLDIVIPRGERSWNVDDILTFT